MVKQFHWTLCLGSYTVLTNNQGWDAGIFPKAVIDFLLGLEKVQLKGKQTVFRPRLLKAVSAGC